MASSLKGLLLLPAIALSACSMPKTHNAVELIGLKEVCFRPNPEMRLTKAFKPGVLSKYQWELQVLTDWRTKPEWWDTSTMPFSTEKSSSPEKRPDVLKISSATHSLLGDVSTMWDYENGYRIVIYGTAHVNSGDLKFVYEKSGTRPFDAKEILRSIFQECSE